MRPKTSSYRRKDGSRRRSYVCRHVHDGTGLCDMPAVDAEAIDTGVINQLDSYLGDFERWREQILSGYDNERERLRREVAKAERDVGEQEKICAKRCRLPDVAEDGGEMQVALRLIREAEEELGRRQNRLRAAQGALGAVPTEAPADAMLDFYNELRDAVRGRLAGANTMARINEALRDIFSCFTIEVNSANRAGNFDSIVVVPLVPPPSVDIAGDFSSVSAADRDAIREYANEAADRAFVVDPDERISPALKPLHVPSAQSANSQE